MMYEVYFLEHDRTCYDRQEVVLTAAETLSDKLEDLLYISHELTPRDRSWREDLKTGACFFTYHGLEHFLVINNGANQILVITCE